MNKETILIVDDDVDMAQSCKTIFELEGFHATTTRSGQQTLKALSSNHSISLVLADLKMPGMDGTELLKNIKKKFPSTDVIIMTGYGTIKTAVESIKLGASDYITKPFNRDELIQTVKKIFENRSLKKEISHLKSSLKKDFGFDSIVWQSAEMAHVISRAEAASRSDSTVFILGESGTGKELVAKAIHYSGARGSHHFIPVNCSAIPSELIESELFGHKKGAFTGAESDSVGLIRAAQYGTIFLDEIAETPHAMQAKLLRCLQDKKVRPVGHIKETDVDVRFIAATNRNLNDILESGKLRKDLYYRLSVLTITIPPLRDRKEDILPLTKHLFLKFNEKFENKISGLSSEALELLTKYDWLGNVRELENFIENLYNLGISGVADETQISKQLDMTFKTSTVHEKTFKDNLSLNDNEKALIQRVLKKCNWNKSEASKLLKISRSRLYEKIKKYQINIEL
jgi:DNA-binding NtrC family response regulator